MTPATTSADTANPSAGISAAQSGTRSTPPHVAPFMAMLTASPRFFSNQGATIALIAAPLMPAHPTAMTARPRRAATDDRPSRSRDPDREGADRDGQHLRGPKRSNASPTT